MPTALIVLVILLVSLIVVGTLNSVKEECDRIKESDERDRQYAMVRKVSPDFMNSVNMYCNTLDKHLNANLINYVPVDLSMLQTKLLITIAQYDIPPNFNYGINLGAVWDVLRSHYYANNAPGLLKFSADVDVLLAKGYIHDSTALCGAKHCHVESYITVAGRDYLLINKLI